MPTEYHDIYQNSTIPQHKQISPMSSGNDDLPNRHPSPYFLGFPRFTWRDFRAISLWPFLEQAYFCGRPTWSTTQIPDLAGKVVIVTGGNTGVGMHTAKVNQE